jgi:hypothetical protein
MSTSTKQLTALEEFDLPNEAHALEVSTTYPLSEPTREARARLGRYSRIQLQDFVARQGLLMVGIALVLAIPIFTAMHQEGTPLLVIVGQIFEKVAAVLIGGGTILATRGVVSEDTQYGFHRFLFSKPLNIPRYYAQAVGIRFVAFLAMLFVLLAPFTLFTTVALMPVMAAAALFFVLVGGLSFLLSTVSRFETQLLLGIGAAAAFSQGAGREFGWTWLRVIGWVLPPFEQMMRIVQYVENYLTVAFPVASAVWVAAYGIGCFAIGLAVLRRRAVPA